MEPNKLGINPEVADTENFAPEINELLKRAVSDIDGQANKVEASVTEVMGGSPQ